MVGFVSCKPQLSPIDSKLVFRDSSSPLFENILTCCRLVGKLIYFMVTCPDNFYPIGLLIKFIHASQKIYCHVALYFLAYLKHSPGHNLLYQCRDHLCVEEYLDFNYVVNLDDHKSI